jgi:hypothetical protein
MVIGSGTLHLSSQPACIKDGTFDVFACLDFYFLLSWKNYHFLDPPFMFIPVFMIVYLLVSLWLSNCQKLKLFWLCNLAKQEMNLLDCDQGCIWPIFINLYNEIYKRWSNRIIHPGYKSRKKFQQVNEYKSSAFPTEMEGCVKSKPKPLQHQKLLQQVAWLGTTPSEEIGLGGGTCVRLGVRMELL